MLCLSSFHSTSAPSALLHHLLKRVGDARKEATGDETPVHHAMDVSDTSSHAPPVPNFPQFSATIMNSIFTTTLSFLILLLSFHLSHSRTSSSTFDLFTAWRHRHGKTYASETEALRRFRFFEANLELINHHNRKGNSSYTLALNSFADLSQEEFRASKLGLVIGDIGNVKFDRRLDFGDDGLSDVPASVDWRKSGAVTYVKDQKSCGKELFNIIA